MFERDGVYFPDTLVGTDSHTTMINGLGIVGWGVGGIEAEAGMLGQPVYFLTPDVVGVHLTGELPQGATATDLVLRITEMLRKANVVGKFVEFFGEGASGSERDRPGDDREYGPGIWCDDGLFPVLTRKRWTISAIPAAIRRRSTRSAIITTHSKCSAFPAEGDVDYTTVLDLDLDTINPSVAGPKRPQDRIELSNLDDRFVELFTKASADGGYGKTEADLEKRYPVSMGLRQRNHVDRRRRTESEIDPGIDPRHGLAGQHQCSHRDRDGEQPSDAGPG